MKILMVNKFFYRRGGAESYLLELRDLLKASGHQVIDFSMQDERNLKSAYSDYFVKNIELGKNEGLLKDLRKGLHVIYSLEAKDKFEALVLKEKPDIIHLHNFCFQLSPSILGVIKKYKIPTVWTLHDYKIICPNQILFTQGQVCERCKIHKYYNCFAFNCIHNNRLQSLVAALEMYLHKLVLKSYEAADLLISPSKFLEQKIKAWKIPAQKIRQLYYFLDLPQTVPLWQMGEGLVYTGRLSKEKGILTLLEAMKELRHLNLKIIGEGPQKKMITDFISKNKLTNVKLIGYLPKEKLLGEVAKSRLAVVPSEWYENNPMVVLEALALGKPVVGSNLGGIPELVKNGITGFTFKSGDAADLARVIGKIYNDESLLAQMGHQAQSLVKQIADPQKHLVQILKFYQQAIDSHE